MKTDRPARNAVPAAPPSVRCGRVGEGAADRSLADALDSVKVPVDWRAAIVYKFLSEVVHEYADDLNALSALAFDDDPTATLFGAPLPAHVVATFQVDDSAQVDFIAQADCTGGGGTGDCYGTDLVGYSAAGVTLAIMLGANTWTQADLSSRGPGSGHLADIYFPATLAALSGHGGSRAWFLLRNITGDFLGTNAGCSPCQLLGTAIASDRSTVADGDYAIAVRKHGDAVPEPAAVWLAMLGMGLSIPATTRPRRRQPARHSPVG